VAYSFFLPGSCGHVATRVIVQVDTSTCHVFEPEKMCYSHLQSGFSIHGTRESYRWTHLNFWGLVATWPHCTNSRTGGHTFILGSCGHVATRTIVQVDTPTCHVFKPPEMCYPHLHSGFSMDGMRESYRWTHLHF
jgi:hypothetical protein